MILALLLVLGWPAPSTYATTLTVRQYDRIDRRVFGVGLVPEQVYFSFSTVYQIGGRTVRPGEFWDHDLTRDVLQIKAVQRRGFWFANRVNLLKENP